MQPNNKKKIAAEQSARDKKRSATLGSGKPKSEIITFNDEEFEIRQPSIEGRSSLRSRATTVHTDGTVDVNSLQMTIWSVIENTYIPDTDILVYEDADYNMLANDTPDGFVDKLGDAISELMYTDLAAKKKGLVKVGKVS